MKIQCMPFICSDSLCCECHFLLYVYHLSQAVQFSLPSTWPAVITPETAKHWDTVMHGFLGRGSRYFEYDKSYPKAQNINSEILAIKSYEWHTQRAFVLWSSEYVLMQIYTYFKHQLANIFLFISVFKWQLSCTVTCYTACISKRVVYNDMGGGHETIITFGMS